MMLGTLLEEHVKPLALRHRCFGERICAVGFLLLTMLSAAQADHRFALIITDDDSPHWGAAVGSCLNARGYHTTVEAGNDAARTRSVIFSFCTSAPINGTAVIIIRAKLLNGTTPDGRVSPVLWSGPDAQVTVLEIADLLSVHAATSRNCVIILPAEAAPEGKHEPKIIMPDDVPKGTSLCVAEDPRAAGKPAPHVVFLNQLQQQQTKPLPTILEQTCSHISGHEQLSQWQSDITKSVTEPTRFPGHRMAGEEWVAHDGGVYCFCPGPSGERGFWVGKFEATQGKWAMPNRFRSVGDRRNLPVVFYEHESITKILKERTAEERNAGRLNNDWEYRLPTNLEWETAARSGQRTEIGDQPISLTERANFADAALLREADQKYLYAHRTLDDGHARLAPVGSFLPNRFGLHDTLGNVWEITSTGDLRGGSWVSLPEYCRIDLRKPPLEFPCDYAGFRIVIAPVDRGTSGQHK